MTEGYRVLKEDCSRLQKTEHQLVQQVMAAIDPSCSPVDFLNRVESDIIGEDATAETIRKVFHLALAVIDAERTRSRISA
jgi:hypothetical protein